MPSPRPGHPGPARAGARAQPPGRLHQVALWRQDEGSQLLALLTDAHRGEMVVDFCAGAGGKIVGPSVRPCATPAAFYARHLQPPARSPCPGIAQRPVQRAPRRTSPMSATSASNAWLARSTLRWSMRTVLLRGTLRRNPDLKWRQTPADGPSSPPSRLPFWRRRIGCPSPVVGSCSPPAARLPTRTAIAQAHRAPPRPHAAAGARGA